MKSTTSQSIDGADALGKGAEGAVTVIEETATHMESCYGLLESVWSDALIGNIDTTKMKDVVELAVQQANEVSESDHLSDSESHALQPNFSRFSSKTASVALTRLGQMLVKEGRDDLEVLAEAQRYQMKAATLSKGLPDPFAHLGYIFEQIASLNGESRMATRAIRCYKKAIMIDVAHPIASRRLCALLRTRNLYEEAADIAQLTCERNPKARWAQNFVGWFKLSRGLFSEAAVCFQCALRGKPNVTSKEEEVLFGTTIGQVEDDNALLIDVDSWRGLSSAYRLEGKVRPALASINEALALVRNPSPLYTICSTVNISTLLESSEALLISERALLLLCYRQASDARVEMASLLRKPLVPNTIGYNINEVYILLAAKEWLQGNYYRATLLREKAATTLHNFLMEQAKNAPLLNTACVYKRLGDSWIETATENPLQLSQIASKKLVEKALSEALQSYLKAAHLSPWKREENVQDISTTMLRMASFQQDESLARQAMELVRISVSDPSIMVMCLLTVAALSPTKACKTAAMEIGQRVAKYPHRKVNTVELNASLASLVSQADVLKAAEFAISAIRRDPTDWRGWYAIAIVREADAKKKMWPPEISRSCEEAFREADRLGGGPVAVQGRVRCITKLLEKQRKESRDKMKVYLDACFCVATASRARMDEPQVCREILHEYQSFRETGAKSALDDLSSKSMFEVYQHVHMFPFLPEVAKFPLSSSY